jgi:RNA polymerase sigma-70 factor, ECF subfamily
VLPAAERFDRLWREYAPAVMRYARRRVPPDEVDEVVAETFVVAWRRLDAAPDHALPWLLGVARNVSANMRRSRRRREALHGRLASQSSDIATTDSSDSLSPPVASALARLRPDDRELLTLLAWDGLDRDGAAQALGCTRAALAVRLHRARRRFASALSLEQSITCNLSRDRWRLMMTRTDHLLDALRTVDPVAPEDASADFERLRRIRASLDGRRLAPIDVELANPSRPHLRRRVAIVAAVAAVGSAVPVAAGIVLGQDRAGRLLPAAVAGDGRLQCGGGYAKAIPPGKASLRLLPADLPSGWSLKRVFARDESTRGWCTPASLTAIAAGADGVVSASLHVTGPVQAIVGGDQAMASDVIDGSKAVRYGDDEMRFYAWIWTDDVGQEWQAEVAGYGLDEARAVMSAVRTEGTDVTLAASGAPQFHVVHRRTGKPYATSWNALAWYVDLDDKGAERSLHVRQQLTDIVPIAAHLRAGARLITIAGKPAILYPRTGNPDKGDGKSFRVLLVEDRPGVVVQTELHDGELPEISRVIGSLSNTDPGDERLERYRLRE